MMRTLLLSFVAAVWLAQPAVCQDPLRFQTEIEQLRSDSFRYSPADSLILFTGSSSIRMWTGLAADFSGYKVLNRGFGGSHMSDLLYYADTLILEYQPYMVFIYEGDNDVASGKEPGEIIADAVKLVDLIRRHLPATAICFIPAKPSLARWHLKDTYLEYNDLLKGLTRKYENVHYVDIWDPLLGEDGTPKKDVFLEDGLHLNRKGYEIWKEKIGGFIQGYVHGH